MGEAQRIQAVLRLSEDEEAAKMGCKVYDQLESEFIRIREQHTQLSMEEMLADEEIQQLIIGEDEARSCLLDHRATHGCKTTRRVRLRYSSSSLTSPRSALAFSMILSCSCCGTVS